MVAEALNGLCINPEGIYVDATFGGGGHSRAILQHLGEQGRLIAFDRDNDATANAIDDARFTLLNEDFRHTRNFLRLHGIRKIDGLLADLGVSSHQFDVAERGFSTRTDGALDLRMDRRQPTTAADLVNNLDQEGLTRLLKTYGELPNAAQMAAAIVRARAAEPIVSTQQLCHAVDRHLPRGAENKYLAMLFQALRIEVNGELDALKALLEQSVDLLNPGGRLVVISYHSLEDRLVKHFMRSGNFDDKVEKDFYGNSLSPLRPVSRGAIKPSDTELEANNRSRSARLRVAERVGHEETSQQ